MELSAVGGSYPRCLPYVAGAGTCDELTCSGSTCHSSELLLAKFGLATWLLLGCTVAGCLGPIMPVLLVVLLSHHNGDYEVVLG